MAVRDGERYLDEALRSLLDQTSPPGEIVVVDDGSTDGTPAILASFGPSLSVHTRPPEGLAPALNLGVDRARRPLLTFLDADDVLTPTSIERRVAHLADRPDLDAVFGHVQQFVSPDLAPADAARYRFDAAPTPGRLLSTMLVHRPAFDRIGPFDLAHTRAPGPDWLARSITGGLRSADVDDVVIRRRLHTTNMSRAEARSGNRHLLGVVRAHRRRRAEQAAGEEQA
nr:glycosyltransferase family A protein [Rhabdothermincola salaria]